MYASDYPFHRERGDSVPRFLADAGLSATDHEAIAHRNWEGLVRGIRR